MTQCTDRLNQVLQTLNQQHISQVAYQAFKASTPIRTGNARSKTLQQGNSINANYPYATRLDEGYSKQAPVGMTVPTLQIVREHVMRQLAVSLTKVATSSTITNEPGETASQKAAKTQGLNSTNTSSAFQRQMAQMNIKV